MEERTSETQSCQFSATLIMAAVSLMAANAPNMDFYLFFIHLFLPTSNDN